MSDSVSNNVARAYDVFISYSSRNSKIANELVAMLEMNKIKCWIAPRDIIPGEVYPEAIMRGLNMSAVTLFIASERSMSSRWCKNEVEVSFKLNHSVVPIRIDSSSIPQDIVLQLATVQWVDVFPDPVEHFDEIIAALWRHIGKCPPVAERKVNGRKQDVTKSNINVVAQWMKVVFRIFDYRGRSNRKEYWTYIVGCIFVLLFVLIVDVLLEDDDMGMFFLAYFFPFLLPF